MPDRRKITVEGLVQGIGLRPFVYRLAQELGLSGFVRNAERGVLIEVEGGFCALEVFDKRLLHFLQKGHKQNRASQESVPLRGEGTFVIGQSTAHLNITAPFPQDFAVCRECLEELNCHSSRRFRFPFISCSECGPRYSICLTLPFDRLNTSLEKFPLCSECHFEYSDPENRRFHAQTIGCHECGPKPWSCRADGIARSFGDEAITEVVSVISDGGIVAVKGIGGIHLICDARQSRAIEKLRVRKARPRKPFALMYPTMDLVLRDCEVSEKEAALLCSPQAPVVLLQKKVSCPLPEGIAPQNACLGVMLPYTPLHYLIMQDLGAPVVATSGNVSGEPICADEFEALSRLGSIADLFLFNDRRIVNRCDDSVVKVILNRSFPIRLARGYAPYVLHSGMDLSIPVLGMGAYLKNTVAFANNGNITVSPHIGDLGSLECKVVQEEYVERFCLTYGVDNPLIATDLHPEFFFSDFLKGSQPPIAVQHHYAHAWSCMVDNDLQGPCFAVTWDGTGLGTDGTIWGGEGLIVSDDSFERRFFLYPFRLPGGEIAIRDPRRVAVGLLFAAIGSQALTHPLWSSYADAAVMQEALVKKVNCPECTSAGRLFDGIAALLGVCSENTFEGEAAMALEYIADNADERVAYDFRIIDKVVIDWRIMLRQILSDVESGVPKKVIAASFHRTLVNIIVSMARLADLSNVLLTGGCFQNSILLSASVKALRDEGFNPFWHQKIPSGDGGIAIGQVVAALGSVRFGNSNRVNPLSRSNFSK
jgi:hydrogenase maturation protein HypF